MKRALAVATSVLALVGLAAVQLPTAAAVDTTKGYAGRCINADARTGTTIVIDFQELDGLNGKAAGNIVRCSPNPQGTARTGVKALQDAGIVIAGTTRWGLGLICRIENRPSATEPLPIAGNPNYHEPCTNSPPGAAYWSYWWADGSTTTWTLSSAGAINRTVVPGGFEGWSFALNRTGSNIPPPGNSPRNPAISATAPTVTLAVNDLDHTITLGASTTLTWSSKKATAVKATSVTPATGGGSWSGALALSGTKTIKPTTKGTYTYKITATGPGGSVSTTAQLIVK